MTSASQSLPRLRVAICTYRRPNAIVRALTAVTREVEEFADAEVRVDIIVVDNDPERSAASATSQFDAMYVSEPRPGIAAVRNRALDESADVAALVFIDDDEVPERGWLSALWTMYRSTGATAVAGRVITVFPPDAPAWVRASGAFIRPTRAHGTSIAEAATNNLLLDRSELRRLELRFDERFGLTGGSDSLLTRQLTARGGTIRWAQDAVVIEQEDPSRFTRRWVLQRTFRFGNTGVRVDLEVAPNARARTIQRLRALARGSIRLVGGLARAGFGLVVRSLRHRASGERTAARGLGMLAAIGGYEHDEYGRRRAAEQRDPTHPPESPDAPKGERELS